MESVKQKTYKREVAFSLMAIEVGLILWSAASESTHIQGLAEFLMPFAATLMAGAFGADWWGKTMIPNKRSE
jgi:hypothetical protein